MTADGNDAAFRYDAENRLIATNMYATSYGYDADGRRVTKTSSGVTTTYVYDVAGQLAAQYATGGTTPCPATCYLMTDHLAARGCRRIAPGIS
jgi:YD repeat-containing protein